MGLYLFDGIEGYDYRSRLPLLPEERRLKALRYSRERDTALCVAAYMLLTAALKEEYGVDSPVAFVYSDKGKPALRGLEGIYFNISHCPHGVACAVSNGQVGVDIEQIKPFNYSAALKVFCENELDALEHTGERELEFARIWTRKEAQLKRDGTGFTGSPRLIDTTRLTDIRTYAYEKFVVSESGCGSTGVKRLDIC